MPGQRAACFRQALEELRDLPIVGDVRGMGYFYAIELVKDTATKATFDADEAERLLRGVPRPELFAEGSSAGPTTAATR